MHKKLCLFLVIFFVIVTGLGYGDITVLDDPVVDGYYWVRVTGSDITSDISTFSDLLVSRDSGRTWETVFANDAKQINWVGATGSEVLGTVVIPAGHYTLARDRGQEILQANVNDGVNPTASVELDLGGADEWFDDTIDMTVERNGSVSLRFDDPIISVEARIKWNGATYDVAETRNDISRAESTGSKFTVE